MLGFVRLGTASLLLLGLAACGASTGVDRSGMSTGSVHSADYTASGTVVAGKAAGQGDFNANTNGVNPTGGVSANSAQGYVGTGSASGH